MSNFMKGYFTPEIEDIRVGYECEFLLKEFVSPSGPPIEEWVKAVFNKYGLELIDTISERIIYYPTPFNSIESGYIRVPYLTKEQIEAEGWIMKETVKSDTSYEYCSYNVFVKPTKIKEGCMDCFEYHYKLYCQDLTPYGQNFYQTIKIEKRTTGGFMGINIVETVYSGKCKDINNFRYICRLLNIS